jgi:hypothetical protein
VFTWLDSSFFKALDNIPLSRFTMGLFFTYLLIEGHLGCLQVLTIMSEAAINIYIWFLYGQKFWNPLGKYQGLQLLVGVYGKNIFIFVKNCHSLFQSGHTTLHSHQLWGGREILMLHLLASIWCWWCSGFWLLKYVGM